jgi:hypothetical protein
MSRSATTAVRIAAAFLPRELRIRYREQWLGDVRDASDVGVSTAEIARGSLAFAATYTRPLFNWPNIAHWVAARWVRLAVALSFSSAIVSISQYPSVVTSSGVDDWSAAGLVVVASTQLLAAFLVLASLLSLVVVFATRGTENRVRLSVGLFVLATVLPMTRTGIDSSLSFVGNPYVGPGTVVFPIAIALVIAAGTILVRMYRSSARPNVPRRLSHRLLTSMSAGLLIVVVAAAGFISMTGAWDARIPLVFGLPLNQANRAAYTQWVMLKFQFEDLVSTIFGVWIIAGLVVACLMAASGFSSRANRQRSTVMFGTVVFSSAVAFGSIINFLPIAEGSTVSTWMELLMAAGRWGLIGLVTAAILRIRGSHMARPQSAESGLPRPIETAQSAISK